MNHYHAYIKPLDQEVDGETLVMLAHSGSMEQLRLCGFKTIKQQLSLRKLISPSSLTTSTSSATAPVTLSSSKAGKLSLASIKGMSSEDKHLYLIK